MAWWSGLAYSQDLRERVLAAVHGGLRVREEAALFEVSISYVYKALERRAATGEVAARRGWRQPPAAAGRARGGAVGACAVAPRRDTGRVAPLAVR